MGQRCCRDFSGPAPGQVAKMLSAENGRAEAGEENSFYFEKRALDIVPCDACRAMLKALPYYDCQTCGRMLCEACEPFHDTRHVVVKIRNAAQHERWRERKY